MARAVNCLFVAMAVVLLSFVARGAFRDDSSAAVYPPLVAPSPIPDAAKAAGYGAQAFADYNAGRLQESVDASLQAIRFNPGSAGYYNTLCAAYNNMQRYDLALDACERALQIDPTFSLARNNRAWALNHRGK
jgi:tetratricopeptide (TPR) repeat protein